MYEINSRLGAKRLAHFWFIYTNSFTWGVNYRYLYTGCCNYKFVLGARRYVSTRILPDTSDWHQNLQEGTKSDSTFLVVIVEAAFAGCFLFCAALVACRRDRRCHRIVKYRGVEKRYKIKGVQLRLKHP